MESSRSSAAVRSGWAGSIPESSTPTTTSRLPSDTRCAQPALIACMSHCRELRSVPGTRAGSVAASAARAGWGLTGSVARCAASRSPWALNVRSRPIRGPNPGSPDVATATAICG